jgi:hypothetical protein
LSHHLETKEQYDVHEALHSIDHTSGICDLPFGKPSASKHPN